MSILRFKFEDDILIDAEILLGCNRKDAASYISQKVVWAQDTYQEWVISRGRTSITEQEIKTRLRENTYIDLKTEEINVHLITVYSWEAQDVADVYMISACVQMMSHTIAVFCFSFMRSYRQNRALSILFVRLDQKIVWLYYINSFRKKLVVSIIHSYDDKRTCYTALFLCVTTKESIVFM